MTYQEMAKWAKWWANRYRWATETRGDIDREDLFQAAMLGILRALDGFKGDGNWAEWSSYFIRKEIRALIGIQHGRIPPYVGSLNAPISNEGDDAMIDLLPDESAPNGQEIAEYNDLQRQVRAAVARLKDDQQREVVERTRLHGEHQSAVADDFGVSVARISSIWNAARKNLARDKALRALADLELRTPYIGRTGARTFQYTHTSDVEYAVMWRERERERIAEIMRRQEEIERGFAALVML